MYLITTFPSFLLIIQSEFYRFATLEQITSKVSHFRKPEYVFIGDSITGGGRNWGLRLGILPFSTVNLSNNGYTVRQVGGLLDKAIKLKPRYILIMAGTNDMFDQRLSDEDIKKDWRSIIEEAKQKSKAELVITSVPIMADKNYDKRIIKINKFLKELVISNGYKFIDLNEILLSQESLNHDRNQYFSDGVHFSEITYKLWTEKIKKVVSH
jgi:lysophospholipase L1-like esterase